MQSWGGLSPYMCHRARDCSKIRKYDCTEGAIVTTPSLVIACVQKFFFKCTFFELSNISNLKSGQSELRNEFKIVSIDFIWWSQDVFCAILAVKWPILRNSGCWKFKGYSLAILVALYPSRLSISQKGLLDLARSRVGQIELSGRVSGR